MSYQPITIAYENTFHYYALKVYIAMILIEVLPRVVVMGKKWLDECSRILEGRPCISVSILSFISYSYLLFVFGSLFWATSYI